MIHNFLLLLEIRLYSSLCDIKRETASFSLQTLQSEIHLLEFAEFQSVTNGR